MKVLVCLVMVCSVWLGVAQGRSLPYHSSEDYYYWEDTFNRGPNHGHSSEERYWGNTFNRDPYRGHSSEENWYGWDDFRQEEAWDNTNRNLGTDWNSLFNTDVNTNWGTDWVNSNDAGREGEESSVDTNNAPDDQKGSGGQEITTEFNVPPESDNTTENGEQNVDDNSNPDDQEISGGHEDVTVARIPSESDITTENGEEQNVDDNSNPDDQEISGGHEDVTVARISSESDITTENGEEQNVDDNSTPDDQEISGGHEDVTVARIPSESDITTETMGGWNGIGSDGAWDNTNRNLETYWNSLFNTDDNTNWETEWMNSNNAEREEEEQNVDDSTSDNAEREEQNVDNSTPDDQKISGGQDVTEARNPSESDITTDSVIVVDYDYDNPSDVAWIVFEDEEAVPETRNVYELFDRPRGLNYWN